MQYAIVFARDEKLKTETKTVSRNITAATGARAKFEDKSKRDNTISTKATHFTMKFVLENKRKILTMTAMGKTHIRRPRANKKTLFPLAFQFEGQAI